MTLFRSSSMSNEEPTSWTSVSGFLVFRSSNNNVTLLFLLAPRASPLSLQNTKSLSHGSSWFGLVAILQSSFMKIAEGMNFHDFFFLCFHPSAYEVSTRANNRSASVYQFSISITISMSTKYVIFLSGFLTRFFSFIYTAARRCKFIFLQVIRTYWFLDKNVLLFRSLSRCSRWTRIEVLVRYLLHGFEEFFWQ